MWEWFVSSPEWQGAVEAAKGAALVAATAGVGGVAAAVVRLTPILVNFAVDKLISNVNQRMAGAAGRIVNDALVKSAAGGAGATFGDMIARVPEFVAALRSNQAQTILKNKINPEVVERFVTEAITRQFNLPATAILTEGRAKPVVEPPSAEAGSFY